MIENTLSANNRKASPRRIDDAKKGKTSMTEQLPSPAPEKTPAFTDSFEYLDEIVGVEWFDLERDDTLPDLPWEQIYAIAKDSESGKVGLVFDASEAPNLPGGKPEDDETVEETLRRELIEEMNYDVLDWWPVGYQRLSYPNGDIKYQLRVYAVIQKRGEFAVDIGGGVIGQKFVDLPSLNEEIRYGKVGAHIVKRLAPEFPTTEM